MNSGISGEVERCEFPCTDPPAAARIGEHLTTWRKLQGLTAEQVAERAGVSRGTLRTLESGEGAVRLETFLNVACKLGVLDRVVEALDSYETDLGRARANQARPSGCAGEHEMDRGLHPTRHRNAPSAERCADIYPDLTEPAVRPTPTPAARTATA
ncbi:helix-turn-helix domain-containing protein [Oerskovia sp. Root918]|uniref:helix-turn-helix domain-containing protein n=1 Tax=Oerskovia sp. Root918 TaxID=1736607 RepID=UPI0009E786E4|nr:helix-turn-helix transcriptional regulator [Oerskovia sp. Root918]